MSCPRSEKEREIVIDYCAGGFEDSAIALEFERHMEHCAECRTLVAEQRRVWEALDHFSAPAVSGDFNARLRMAIEAENGAPAWRRWLNRMTPVSPVAFWKPALSLAAAGAALAVGLMVHAPKPAAPETHVQAAVQTQQVDIEQVANALDELDVLAPSSI